MITSVIADGRDGAASAALAAATRLGIRTAGYRPKGTYNGGVYGIVDAPSDDFSVYTCLNIIISTGTLILGQPTEALNLVRSLCLEEQKPHLWLKDLEVQNVHCHFRMWAERNKITSLHVAGPREKRAPGFSLDVERFLWESVPSCK